eukprot:1730571-Ditylum_brightwellii.AAC.1
MLFLPASTHGQHQKYTDITSLLSEFGNSTFECCLFNCLRHMNNLSGKDVSADSILFQIVPMGF